MCLVYGRPREDKYHLTLSALGGAMTKKTNQIFPNLPQIKINKNPKHLQEGNTYFFGGGGGGANLHLNFLTNSSELRRIR